MTHFMTDMTLTAVITHRISGKGYSQGVEQQIPPWHSAS